MRQSFDGTLSQNAFEDARLKYVNQLAMTPPPEMLAYQMRPYQRPPLNSRRLENNFVMSTPMESPKNQSFIDQQQTPPIVPNPSPTIVSHHTRYQSVQPTMRHRPASSPYAKSGVSSPTNNNSVKQNSFVSPDVLYVYIDNKVVLQKQQGQQQGVGGGT